MYREEMMWMQRPRMDWLREGDKNTNFFHSKAVWRARKNKIKMLKDDEGRCHTDRASMSAVVMSYFQNLFQADPNIDPDPVVGLFEGKKNRRNE
jgi:hypothetical protein